jgi:hypothetical protein
LDARRLADHFALRPPFEFTGTILSVTVDISGPLLHDTEEEEKAFARVAMARQ